MRALVLDESSLQRRFVTWLLREFRDLEVSESAESVGALNLLLTQPFTLVLMELRLPVMDGLTLLHKLRNTPGPNTLVPVVIISTLSDEATQSKAKALGVVEYLTKPVPAVKVRDVVREQLQQPTLPPRPGEEKRVFPRLQLAVTVRFPAEPPLTLTTGDVSPYGAFLITDSPKAVGTLGVMTLDLPHLSKPLTVEFEVVHARQQAVGDLPQGFGVRFTANDSNELARLAAAFANPSG